MSASFRRLLDSHYSCHEFFAFKDMQHSPLVSTSKIDNVSVKKPRAFLLLLIPLAVFVVVRVIFVVTDDEVFIERLGEERRIRVVCGPQSRNHGASSLMNESGYKP